MQIHQLLDRIQAEQDRFPVTQRKVAAYVVENYKQIPFLSISALAGRIGVSNNTVINFCSHLGFDKFADFKRVFSEYAHSELEEPGSTSEISDSSQDDFFARRLNDDVTTIRQTLSNPINQENIPRLLEMMANAKHIYVIGGRASGLIAGLLANFLRYLGPKVYELNFGVGDYLDRIAMVGKDDLVIAFSFPRYTSAIVDLLADLHESGTPIALITDTGLSPARPYADPVFYCAVSSDHYFPNYTGCVALINAICQAASAYLKRDTSEHVRKLEELLQEHDIFR